MNRPTRGAVVGIAWTLLLLSGAATFVDPDVWHLMALARETFALGYIPLDDRFAYTPTVFPSVQHEWGSGMLLYFLATHGGVPALQLARAVCIAALAWNAVRVARMRGADAAALAILAPLAIVMTWIGLTALRPQLLSLVFMSAWLVMIERDRRGGRRWILFALPAHLLWLNLHGGFVVGMIFLALHALEQAVRRRPYAHVIGVLAAMAILVAANPYGPAYYRYLFDALSLPRPNIGEWQPIWRAHPVGLGVYLVTLTIAVVGLVRRGPSRVTGWPILAASAYFAASHERHVSIWALVWFAYVPAMVAATPLGSRLRSLWERPAGPATQALGLVALMTTATLFTSHRPWRLSVPGTTRAGALDPYPVGPVDYLRANAISANVLVPFGVGAYVSWNLHPRVKVSFDSRYEVAYPPELLPAHIEFFAARPGWREFLAAYPTDLVLAPAAAPAATALATQTDWRAVYRDDAYVMFARPGLALPSLDRRGARIVGTFP
jgi:hypothetical protein